MNDVTATARKFNKRHGFDTEITGGVVFKTSHANMKLHVRT